MAMAKTKSRKRPATRTRQKAGQGVAARRAKRRRPAARKKKSARKTRRTARPAGRAASRRPSRPKAAARRKASRKQSSTSAAARPKASGQVSKKTARVGGGKTVGRGAPPANPRGSSGPGTNPWPTKRSTRTGAGAGVSRSPYLERERRRLRETEEEIQTPPSSLDLDRTASAARTGRQELKEALREHTETSPALTGGDIDADWQNAYSQGDEAPGGDNPTPDQDRVDEIGKALGLQYEDNEELKGVDKIAERDRHRWELDPASAEDYRERQKE